MSKKKNNKIEFCHGALFLSVGFIIFFFFTIWTMMWFDTRMDNLEDYTWNNQITSWKCIEWKVWDQMEVSETGEWIKVGEEKRCSRETATRESPHWGLIA